MVIDFSILRDGGPRTACKTGVIRPHVITTAKKETSPRTNGTVRGRLKGLVAVSNEAGFILSRVKNYNGNVTVRRRKEEGF